MLTGKALIGVGANAAVGHAILQHASKLMLPRAFVFNGVKHQVLNQTSVLKSSKEAVQFDYVMIGEGMGYITNITDTQIQIEFDNGDVSYTLADFYDNVIVFSDKKIAKNLAQYVAAFVDNGKDPRAESVNVNGYTIDVAIGMLMAGVDFETVHYFLSQPTLFSFVEEYLNNGGNVQALDKLRTKYGISRDISLEKYQPRDYSKDALEAAIGTKQFDKKLIEDFLFYKKLSKPIAELIQAVKQGEQGVGPLIEDAIFRLELINSENIDQIIGAREFLNNQSLMQNKINSVLDYGLDFLVEKAGMIDVRRGIYQQVRNILSDYKSETLLTVKELKKINQTLYDYLISGFKGVNSELINELPNRLTEYKKLNPENEYKAFLNRLYVEDGVIVYSGLTGADNLELERIRESWAKMLHDPEAAQLANDLVDYSFHRGGFRISSSSFSSLQPVHFYRMNNEFNSYIKKQLENLEHDPGIFLNQYIRHNWRSLSSVPNIKAEINGVYINLNDTIVTKIAINSDQTRIALDKNGQVVPFIKHKPIIEGTNTEVQLLELVEVQGDYAYYAPALPLGLYKNTGTAKGVVLEEYQYDVIPERSMFNERLGSVNIEEQPVDSSPLSLSSSLFKQLLSIEDLSSFEEQVRAVKDKQLVVSPEQKAKLNEHYVRIKNKPVINNITPISSFTNHSGGAKGYDAEWDLIGSEFGMVNNKHYLLPSDGNVSDPRLLAKGVKPVNAINDVGVVVSSGLPIGEAQIAVTQAERIMGRIESNHVTRNTKKIRNYAQVKNADGVFAIGSLIPKGTEITLSMGRISKQALVPQVNGGTSVAVQLGIMMNKPTYVFNQVANDVYIQGWYKWDNNQQDFVSVDTPILTKNFAGIGTSSNTTEQGKQAIRDVYQKTISLIGPFNNQNNSTIEKFTWARKADNSYEVSSKGDKRFSALVAKLNDGRTIEEAYQLDVKGYRVEGDNWRLGKGKAPLREITYEQQYQEYKDLWKQYLNENPELLNDLREKARGKVITDMFASTPVSQARALAEILNETSNNNQNNSISFYEGNIKPEPNTIFVFGSNPEGRHGAGAAKIAKEQFGAIYGQGEGLQGNAYALPTKDLRVKENKGFKSISTEQIITNIKKLYETAIQNPDKQFKVSYRNTTETSLNGYTGLEMIDMFIAAGQIPSNIIFSKEWVDTGKFNNQQNNSPLDKC
jgi:hypothetical protein